MITKEEREVLRKFIGKQHISKISVYMRDNGIVNRMTGIAYTREHISRIFNGQHESKRIENAIYAYLESIVRAKKKNAMILNSAKELT